jgi:small subunit ribosomal protein S19
MSRSKWKGHFVDTSLNRVNKKNLKIWSRRSTIPFSLIGSYVLIHNGKDFKKVYITREKVGFKFGEFAFTRKYISKYKNLKSTGKKKK